MRNYRPRGPQLQKRDLHASEQDLPRVARRRLQWQARQASVDPRRLVFIDVTWTKTNMTPIRGPCAAGKCLIAKVPYGNRKTQTFVAALRYDSIVAPCVLDQPVNAVSFRAYVEQYLVSTLRPGKVVVMDKLSSHKEAAIFKAIRDAGAKLFFLPPHSPDLNPIEQVFAELKTLRYKANARTMESAQEAIKTLLDETLRRGAPTTWSTLALGQPKAITL